MLFTLSGIEGCSHFQQYVDSIDYTAYFCDAECNSFSSGFKVSSLGLPAWPSGSWGWVTPVSVDNEKPGNSSTVLDAPGT